MTTRTPDSGSEPQIPPETLAAFMEGALTEEERAEVLRILASSDADLDILADAIAALASVEEEAPPIEVLSGPSEPTVPSAPEGSDESSGADPTQERRGPWLLRPPIWLSAAAVVALLWAVPGVLSGPDKTPVDPWAQLQSVGEALRVVPMAPEGVFTTAGRSSVRGEEALLSDEARTYRIGATLATLAASEFAGRDLAGDEALGRITRLLDAVPGGPLLATRLAEVAAIDRRPGASGPGEEWEGVATALAESIPESPHFRLGLWVEAARIEAIARPWPEGGPAPDGGELQRLGAAITSAEAGALVARVEEARRLLEVGAPAPEVIEALEAISAEAWGG